jgi:hypothetical protein
VPASGRPLSLGFHQAEVVPLLRDIHNLGIRRSFNRPEHDTRIRKPVAT